MTEHAPLLTPLPYSQAIAWAKARGVVLPEAYYGELQGFARAQSFSIASLAQLDQLQAVKDSLAANLASGETMREWQARVRSGEIGLELPDYRLENIYRTNIQGSYARGRCEQQARVVDQFPWFMYDAINDSRTRPAHAAMDGFIARHDDPVWDAWTPPCGYQCRCRRIALTEKQAAHFRTADAKRMQDPDNATARAAAQPDKGWDYSPCKNPDEGLRRAVEAKRATADHRLMAKYDQATTAAMDSLSAPVSIVVSGSPSPAFVADMQSVMASLPQAARQVLREAGVQARATDFVTSAHPYLVGQHPRGWPDGSTWDNADGLCHEWREPVVAEKFRNHWLGNKIETSLRSRYVLAHESGHAYDKAAGWPSDSKSFRDAYASDIAADPRFSDGSSAIDDYLKQSGDAGPQEAFATLFGHAVLGHGDQNMPNTSRWIRAMLGIGDNVP